MPKLIKLPKYKKGYTWRHYLDEWWDRAGTEFKVKLFCFVVIGLLVSAAGLVFFVSQKMERNSLMEIGKAAKIKAAAEADGLIQKKISDNRASPAFQQAPLLEIRGGAEKEDYAGGWGLKGNGTKRKTADRTSDQGGHGAGVSNRVFELCGESVFPVPTGYLRGLSKRLTYDVCRDEAKDEAEVNHRGLPE